MTALTLSTGLLDWFDEVFDRTPFQKLERTLSTYDDDGNQVFTVEMPGVAPEDVSVEYNSANRYLHVEGKRADIDKSYKTSLWAFDSTTDPARAEASMKHGVLTIKVPPKEQEETRRKQIPVKT